MSINDIAEKIKSKRESIFVLLLILLTGSFGFGLGRISHINSAKTPVKINFPTPSTLVVEDRQKGEVLGSEDPILEVSSGVVVGSKNSDKYHFPWCSGAKRIKEENLVTFASIEKARTAGYIPAKNCKGLE